MIPVTIGLPFYNAEKYLADAIRSVFAQTYQNWELILIDDGSTDNSLKIANSVKDSRVRVYSDGENKKLAARLNEIVQLANYDVIARMDADDLMSPTRLEKQLKILKKYPEVDLVTTGLYSITNNLELLGARWHHATSITFDELLYKRGCGVVHAALLGKKSWFERNPYDTTLKIAQDYDLWLRASSKNDFSIHLLQQPLYYYREAGAATPKKMLNAYRNERVMYKKYAKRKRYFLIVKSFLKSFIVKVLQNLNQFQILVKRRSAKVIDKDVLNQFQTELMQVKQTNVKGLKSFYSRK
ncbi:glycosyltransferase family 2 protein [Lutibacter sp.]